MQLSHSQGHLYRNAIMALVQTPIGNTQNLDEAALNVHVYADHNFVDEHAEGVLTEKMNENFVCLVSFTAHFQDREQQAAKRLIFLLASEDKLGLAFVDAESIDDYLDDGDVDFELYKNLFAYAATEIGQVAKIIREFTMAGILPDGNHAFSEEGALDD